MKKEKKERTFETTNGDKKCDPSKHFRTLKLTPSASSKTALIEWAEQRATIRDVEGFYHGIHSFIKLT